MASRPSISDETIKKVEKWIDANPEKGITEINKAIEYLVDQAITDKQESEDVNEKAVRQIVNDVLDEKLDN